jgi:hypothetical protein
VPLMCVAVVVVAAVVVSVSPGAQNYSAGTKDF